MEIAAFWSPKGGAGKTMLAYNVAGDLTFRGYKVLLCDLDPQGSSLSIKNLNKLNFQIIGGMPQQKPDSDFVIIDYPPRYEELPECKKVVVPINPSRVDLMATRAAISQISSKDIQQVPNNIIKNQIESRELVDYITQQQNHTPVIHRRVLYSRIQNDGRTVFQKGPGYSSAYLARDEIRNLTNIIFNLKQGK